jgi:hypothetical protein
MKRFFLKLKSIFSKKEAPKETGHKQLKFVQMRMQTDSYWFETLIDEDMFKPTKRIGDEIFGFYGNSYVSIKVNNK